MDKFRIAGGRQLRGRVAISGAKNSALPCLAASLLTAETVTLGNVPYVRDLITMRRVLEDLGATVLVPELRTHRINAGTVENYEAPYELVKTMRASILTLGPLLIGVVALGISFLVTPTFTATTKFLPPQQQQSANQCALARRVPPVDQRDRA